MMRLYSDFVRSVLGAFKVQGFFLPLARNLLGVFAPSSRGCKNLRACGGHPVGEEIDYVGFVCSRPTNDMHGFLLLFFFLNISLHFISISLLVYLHVFSGGNFHLNLYPGLFVLACVPVLLKDSDAFV